MASTRATQILSGVADGTTADAGLPQRLVTACTQALPVTGVGLALMTEDGAAGTVAVTDGVAKTMEDLQFSLGEGPCLDSSRTGRPVLQPDLARTGPVRWPGFCDGALGAGIMAIFAFPLRMGDVRLGVLDLYRDRAGALTDDELREALAFADAATALLLRLAPGSVTDGASADSLLGQVPVLEDRAEVHQATGMIFAFEDCTLSQALVLLRARSFATGRPILSIARDVIARGGRLVDDDDDLELDGVRHD